jgi:hypothetical protein
MGAKYARIADKNIARIPSNPKSLIAAETIDEHSSWAPTAL